MNVKHINTIPSFIAHGFFNIHTSEMVNDLNDAHAQKTLPSIESSQQLPLSTISEDTLDELSDNSDDPTNPSTNQN